MSENFPKILIIPIDNRPVCYDLALNITNMFKGAKVFMPDISVLGGLNLPADIAKIQGWVEHIINSYDIDIAVVALDTIAYGGLISSRRTDNSFDTIKANIDSFIEIINKGTTKPKIYAVSSIMRISNNNCNEEEKSYWGNFGTDLFRFSYLSHKLLSNYDVEIESELISLANKIPFEVVDDYLDSRKRNFDINSYYVELVKNGIFEHLVFSQDDTAEFGFNVEEKELLQKLALKELVSDKVTVKTGADEMILSLLSRAFCDFYSENVEINPVYFSENAKQIISLYEDSTIQDSVEETIELCGGEVVNGGNLKLLVNAPNEVQDELCLHIFKDREDNTPADKLIDFVNTTESNYILADIKKANGADNYLVEKFLELMPDVERFYGYAAWNTTGNTLGTVVSAAIIKYIAIKHGVYSNDAFKKLQYIRFMDDWAYQANVRDILRQNNSTDGVMKEMRPFEIRVSTFLGEEYPTYYSFPWDRTFEIKINI